jgi:hypothetical protein
MRKVLVGAFFLLISTAGTALADISAEYGNGREQGTLEMITLFNRESTKDEWVTFQLHAGRILRKKEIRLEKEGASQKKIEEQGDETDTFPFYGIDMAVGHSSLNPYVLILLGATQFDKLSHRLGTPWNFHLGLEFGSHGPSFGWFLRLHHWSNGPEITAADGPNQSEEFGTLGLEWRWR